MSSVTIGIEQNGPDCTIALRSAIAAFANVEASKVASFPAAAGNDRSPARA